MTGRKSLIEITGLAVGSLVVARRARNRPSGEVAYVLRCHLGHEHALTSSTIRKAMRLERELPCPECEPLSYQSSLVCSATEYLERRSPHTCSRCHRSGHDVRSCPDRPAAKRRCLQCEGLPHRRPKRGLCACGESYAPEAPITVADIHSQPRDSRWRDYA